MRLKVAQTERGNTRGERNKMAVVFTDLLTQKSTPLSMYRRVSHMLVDLNFERSFVCTILLGLRALGKMVVHLNLSQPNPGPSGGGGMTFGRHLSY